MYEMSGNKYAVMGPALEWKKAYDQQDFIIQQYSDDDLVHRSERGLVPALRPNGWNTTRYEAPATHFNRHYARCQVTHLGETVNPFVSPYQVAQAAVEKLGEENVFDPDAYKLALLRVASKRRVNAWAEDMGQAKAGRRCSTTSTTATPRRR